MKAVEVFGIRIKTCPKCHREWRGDEVGQAFGRSTRRADGLQAWCRGCRSRVYHQTKEGSHGPT